MRDFRKLGIWTLGMDIVTAIYSLIKELPKEEKYGLRSQITRAAVSLPSNIAEGCSRSSNKELNRFLEVSIGSSFELETQIIICKRLNLFNQEKADFLLKEVGIFQKMCNSFRNKILSDIISQRPIANG